MEEHGLFKKKKKRNFFFSSLFFSPSHELCSIIDVEFDSCLANLKLGDLEFDTETDPLALGPIIQDHEIEIDHKHLLGEGSFGKVCAQTQKKKKRRGEKRAIFFSRCVSCLIH